MTEFCLQSSCQLFLQYLLAYFHDRALSTARGSYFHGLTLPLKTKIGSCVASNHGPLSEEAQAQADEMVSVRLVGLYPPFHLQLWGLGRPDPGFLLEPQSHPHVLVGEWFLLKLFIIFMNLLNLLEPVEITIIRNYFTTRKKLADYIVWFYHFID